MDVATSFLADAAVRNRFFKWDVEGLDFLYTALGGATLAYARRFESMPSKETIRVLRKSVSVFEDYLIAFLGDARCMTSTELLERRLMKRKHYTYAAYLAVISSFPILRGNIPSQDLIKAIVAKIAEIVSIKTLDNVNDALHTHEQALRSLRMQLGAFTSPSFNLQERHDDIGRAENSTYQLALFTNQLVSRATDRRGPAFRLYLEDFGRYVKGQTSSMDQKLGGKKIINIRDFLIRVNEKAVGRIWLAVDFCFLNSFWYLDAEDLKAIDHVRTAADLIFKGCNIYDDIADLETDLQNKILNSIVLLALDNGLCEERDLARDPITLKTKLEGEGALYLALELGDLIFSMGLKELEEARDYASRIDIDGLEYGTRILRLFAMRKWLTRQHNPARLFKPLSLQVSEAITDYAKYVV